MFGSPEDLRREAEAMERLAGILSYGRDKARLTARAAEFRASADVLELRRQERRGQEMEDPAPGSRRGV